VLEDRSGDISLVLPTFNRAGALRANLGAMLALEDVGEVIVINDGSTDDTIEACSEFDDARLKLVTHERNLGVASARNTGIDTATRPWILFGEDDCRFPADYGAILRREGELLGADIVGAPLLRVAGDDADAAALAAASPRRERPPTMDEDNVFTERPVRTPFLPARALVRRAVFDRIRFFEGYPSNAYREETDFFVQAARTGFVLFLTPATYCYQLETWDGGQHHSSALRYEYWAVRNNWTFLRRHGAWLSTQGLIDGVVRSQVEFVLRRVRTTATGAIRARVHRRRLRRERTR
jgi:glycosyltransferase involved in cell wall biosynthesis